MKCYDPGGKEHDKSPVDAKECVKVLGWSLQKKKETEKPKATARKQKKQEDVNANNS